MMERSWRSEKNYSVKLFCESKNTFSLPLSHSQCIIIHFSAWEWLDGSKNPFLRLAKCSTTYLQDKFRQLFRHFINTITQSFTHLFLSKKFPYQQLFRQLFRHSVFFAFHLRKTYLGSLIQFFNLFQITGGQKIYSIYSFSTFNQQSLIYKSFYYPS